MVRKLVSRYSVWEKFGKTSGIIFYYQDGEKDFLGGISAGEVNYIIDLLRHETPVFYDHELKRLSIRSPEPIGETEITPDLDAWLRTHATVAASIVWEDSNGSNAWSSWDAGRKTELRQAFELARNRSSIPVAEVPPNQAAAADNEKVKMVLAPADAWAYFKASVAQSLAAEIGGQLLWSLLDYSSDQLAELFDSRKMFRWKASYAGYQIDHNKQGRVVPAPPRYSYEFLGTAGIIGNSRLDTIAHVIDWCRANLVHFSGGITAANMEDHWQYRGYPPLTRVLAGTVRTSHPQSGIKHFTAGCRGTTGLLQALLRVVNIPVRQLIIAKHALPWFMADSRYLSHGDDPYNKLTVATPPIPASELLIDQPKFEAWFSDSVSASDKANNIGRHPRELAIAYLPNSLLQTYCSDLKAGKCHADGQVFATFSNNYTVAQLEVWHLWSRMDAKIANFGGCANIP